MYNILNPVKEFSIFFFWILSSFKIEKVMEYFIPENKKPCKSYKTPLSLFLNKF